MDEDELVQVIAGVLADELAGICLSDDPWGTTGQGTGRPALHGNSAAYERAWAGLPWEVQLELGEVIPVDYHE